MSKEKIHNMANCMLSILDSLKLYDSDNLFFGDETSSEIMFRKMKAYNIDLNKELGLTHLKPISRKEVCANQNQEDEHNSRYSTD